MRTQLNRFRQIVGMPNALAIATLLFGQSLLQLLESATDTVLHQLAVLVALGAGVLFLYRRFMRAATDGAAVMGQLSTAKLARRRGIVMLVGLDSDQPGSDVAQLLRTAGDAEYLAMLGTPETLKRGVVARIRNQLLPALGRSIPSNRIRVWEQNMNAESIADFEQSTRDAVAWMLRQGLSPEEIVVDVSAGRRPMAFGALTAAGALEVEVQYLAAPWDAGTNTPIRSQRAFKVVREFYPDEVDGSQVLPETPTIPAPHSVRTSSPVTSST